MPHHYASIFFTPSVRQTQAEQGSSDHYASMTSGDFDNDRLGDRESEFVQARDSFYMATVSETGWPYLQHRGGPAGFVRVVNERTLGFADFAGNRQYISAGNLARDHRVSLFFMDYASRRRLKLAGRITPVDPDDIETLGRLTVADYRARVERAYLIHVNAWDWNCPQHITPRFTETEVREAVESLRLENERLRRALTRTTEGSGTAPR